MSEIHTSIMHNVLRALYSTTLSEVTRRNVVLSYMFHQTQQPCVLHEWGRMS